MLNKKTFSITKDISANLKKLLPLEKNGIIKIYQVNIETLSKKIQNLNFPIGVLDYTHLNGSLVASDEDEIKIEKIKQIIGKNKIGDVIHLYTHIREKHDYFVTEDHDILDKKLLLEKEFFGLKIISTNELIKELTK